MHEVFLDAAGKTTLLDVLAGRKATGKQTGEIFNLREQCIASRDRRQVRSTS